MIPKVVKVIFEKRSNGSTPFKIPKTCQRKQVREIESEVVLDVIMLAPEQIKGG